ncbi:MAG: polysaccharide biosynthesis C-terminal domain-containing protein [Oscillospiraceae bacterium]|nr:polysaccharide biosynthesis C-terminal domain-containing protein [Oscillospiraceae bacterium]
MRRPIPIFYNALMLTGADLLLRLISTAFQVFLSGTIGAAGIGLLQLVLSVGGLTVTAGMAGIRTATMYLTAHQLGRDKPGGVIWILSGACGYSLLCSAAVGASVYVLAPLIAARWIGAPTAVHAVRLLAAFLPVSCLCGVMTGYFTAAARIGTLATVEVTERLCSMAVTVVALRFWAGTDPGRACVAVICGSCVGSVLTLLCLVSLRLRERPPRGPRLPVVRPMLSAALPLALGDDLKVGINTLENLMVPRRLALYHGAEDPLALFGTVCGMVFPVLMFPAAILFGLTELLIPEMARCAAAGSRDRISYLTRRTLRTALLYGACSGSILYLIAPELCMALYDSPEAGIHLRRFATLTVMLYCDIVTDAMIKGLGQQKISVRYNILTSAMDVALLFLLLPTFGMEGYFFSFLITHLINFALSLRRLLKITGHRISLHIPLLTLTTAVLSVYLSLPLPSPTLRICAFLPLLLSLLTLTGVLSKEDLQWLQNLLKRPSATPVAATLTPPPGELSQQSRG